MLLDVFDVDHGACALITTSNRRNVMIDCGHHAGKGWFPGAALNNMGIDRLDQLIVSNFDEDHVSGFPDLTRRVSIDVLVKNGSVGTAELRAIKAEHGMGAGIRHLHSEMVRTFTGGAPSTISLNDYGDTSFRFFRNRYDPVGGLTDANNLSLVTFVQCGPHKIVFPGDLEKPGWRLLLEDPAFVRELTGVTIFVASHHGRENGYCQEAMACCPEIEVVVFSDNGISYATQETAHLYRRHASGLRFGIQTRRVLTTRTDNSMQFQLNPAGGGRALLNVAA